MMMYDDVKLYLNKKIKLFLENGYLLNGNIIELDPIQLKFKGKFGEVSIVELEEIKMIIPIINGVQQDD